MPRADEHDILSVTTSIIELVRSLPPAPPACAGPSHPRPPHVLVPPTPHVLVPPTPHILVPPTRMFYACAGPSHPHVLRMCWPLPPASTRMCWPLPPAMFYVALIVLFLHSRLQEKNPQQPYKTQAIPVVEKAQETLKQARSTFSLAHAYSARRWLELTG